MLENLLKDAEFEVVNNGESAGTGTTNCSEVDMAGYDSVTFIALIGTIVATGTVDMKVQQDTATGMASAADLEGTKVSYTSDDDNKLAIVEVVRPQERFVRAVIVRATANATIQGVIAIKRNAKNKPTSQSSSHVVASELHLSPAEGTA